MTMSDRSIGDDRTSHGGSGFYATESVGDSIAGKFLVLRLIGRGGMGAVYECLDKHLQRPVAVKRLAVVGSGFERFLREAKSVAKLSHSGIVTIHEYGVDDRGPYMVMELLEGADLSSWVKQSGPMPAPEVLRVAREICRALDYAHGRGIVHRDLKPSNLFRLPDGTIKLLDFGLARVEEDAGLSQPQLSVVGLGMGTADYAAPEQREDASRADARSDIYSLGATLYFLATGRSPRVMSEKYLPSELRALVLQLVEEHAADRPRSVEAVVELISRSERDATVAPQPVEEDDLGCPKCKTPNALEAKLCRRCGASLRAPCPACLAEIRHGLANCDQCGASSSALEKVQAALREVDRLTKAGQLSNAETKLTAAQQLADQSRLGAKTDAIKKDLRTRQQSIRTASTKAASEIDLAKSLAQEGRYRDALQKLAAALALDGDRETELAASRASWTQLSVEMDARIRDAEAELAAGEKCLAAAALKSAEAHFAKAKQLLSDPRLGVAASKHLARVQQGVAKVQKARKGAQQGLKDAAALARDGHVKKALSKLDAALRLDGDRGEEMEKLRRQYSDGQKAVDLRLGQARGYLTGAGASLAEGNLNDCEFSLHAALETLTSGPSGDTSDLLAEHDRIAKEMERRRAKVLKLKRLIEEDLAHSRFESAGKLLEKARSIEAGLDWVTTGLAGIPIRIEARERAIVTAKQLIQEALVHLRNGRDRQAQKLLDDADSSLRESAPGVFLDERAVARKRLATFRAARSRRRKVALAALLILLTAFLVRRHFLRKEYEVLRASAEQHIKDLRPLRTEAGADLGATLESEIRAQLSEIDRSTNLFLGHGLEDSKRRLARVEGYSKSAAEAGQAIAEFAASQPELAELTSRLQEELSAILATRPADERGVEERSSRLGRIQRVGEQLVEIGGLLRFAGAVGLTSSQGVEKVKLDLSGSTLSTLEAFDLKLQDALATLGAAVSFERIFPGCEILEVSPDQAKVSDTTARASMTATDLPWRIRHKLTGVELILCPPGEFLMGSTETERPRFADEAQHPRRIRRPFYMGRTEVTQQQWQSVMKSNSSFFNGADLPVDKVSWTDCDDFCRMAGLQLPSEAQWEYACRAGTQTCFGFGDSESDLSAYAWFGEVSNGSTHAVGQKAANAWGFFDLHGNVREWCGDTYGEYPSEGDEQLASSGPIRVVRGGGWNSRSDECRSAFRNYYDPGYASGSIGFRVVLAPVLVK